MKKLFLLFISFIISGNSFAAAAGASASEAMAGEPEAKPCTFRMAEISDIECIQDMAARSAEVTDPRFIVVTPDGISSEVRKSVKLTEKDPERIKGMNNVYVLEQSSDDGSAHPIGFIAYSGAVPFNEIYPPMTAVDCSASGKKLYLSDVSLILDPAFRGKGLGKELHDRALSLMAKEYGRLYSDGIYAGLMFRVFIDNRRERHIISNYDLSFFCATADESPSGDVHMNLVYMLGDFGKCTYASRILHGEDGKTIQDEFAKLAKANIEEADLKIKRLYTILTEGLQEAGVI